MATRLVKFEAFLRHRQAHQKLVSPRNRALSATLKIGFVISFFALLFQSRNVAVLIALPVFIVLSEAVQSWLNNREQNSLHKHSPLQASQRLLIEELIQFADKGTLEERFHPAVATQIEQICDQFFRIQEWLQSKSSQEILGKSNHADLSLQLDSTMRDTLLCLSGSYRKKGVARKEWQKRIDADPNAAQYTNDLAKVSGLLSQISEITSAMNEMGMTITLSDRLADIRNAIRELDEELTSSPKALEARIQS